MLIASGLGQFVASQLVAKLLVAKQLVARQLVARQGAPAEPQQSDAAENLGVLITSGLIARGRSQQHWLLGSGR